MITQSAGPSRRNNSSVIRRRSRALHRAILETLEPRTLLSGSIDPPLATLDFSSGFANNTSVTLNGGAAISGSDLQLAGGSTLYYINNVTSYRGSGPELSAWSTDKQDITQFTTSFNFKNSGTTPGVFAFTIQGNSNTDPGGAADRTFALVFDLTTGDTYEFVNGRALNVPGSGRHLGIDFNNADTYNVSLNTLSYGLGEVVTDLTTGSTSSGGVVDLDLPAIVSGGSAFVGFTGGPDAPDITSWSYTAPAIGNTPFAPTYTISTLFPHQITLDWTDNSSNEDGFEVEKTTDGITFSHLAYVSADVTTYTDAGLPTSNASLGYRVRAFNSFGSSVAAPTATGVTTITPPAAPTNASATIVSANEVDLSWQDNTASTTGGYQVPYQIYRRSGGTGDFSLIATVHRGWSSYADTQAPSNSQLEYRIVGCYPGDRYKAESDPVYVSATTPSTSINTFGPLVVFNGSAHLIGSSLSLIDDQPGPETSSAWSNNYQDVSQFTTQFSFRFANSDPGGITFSMLGDSPLVHDGRTALGDNSALGFGANFFVPYERGIQFYLGGPTGNECGTGILPGGPIPSAVNSIDVTSSGINFGSGHMFNITLSYNRGSLKETITDAVTSATFTHTYWTILDSDQWNYVGFTGSKPGTSQQGVDVSSWSYSGGNPANPTTTFLVGNTAPVLTGANDFPSITEDDRDNGGVRPYQLNIGHRTDADSYQGDGIAITGYANGHGTWQYLDTNTSQWKDIGPVSDTSALLLGGFDDQLRFRPDGMNGTTASLTFRVWDQTNGYTALRGTRVDASMNGGSTAYSADTASANITVTDVNDAPTLNGSNDFPSITEDDLNNNGQTVAELIVGHASDVDSNAQPAGIAVYGQNTFTGTWQYSLDNGGTWTSFGSMTQTSATVLAPDARVRLLPNGQFGTNSDAGGGLDSITFTAWDRTDGIASGTTGVNTVLPNNVFGFRISPYGGAGTSSIFVADVNDAPVLNGVDDFPTIKADDVANNGIYPNGLSVLILGHESDSDLNAPYTGNAHNTRAVAIVDQNAGNGTWQYLKDGLTWTNIGAVSNTSALLITSQAVRFIPNGHNGTTASLTLRAWDASNGVELTGTYADTTINGGTSSYSAQTATTHITVTPIIVITSLTITASNTVYNAYPYVGATATVTPSADNAPITFTYYAAADSLRTTPIPAPINAGTYQVVAHLAAIPGYTAADSAPATFTIAKAPLTGIASTQDALNIAKQGAFTIDINSLTSLQGTDTVVSIFSSALFNLTIGANTYLFAPTVTVDAATQTIHVAYSLKAGTASADTLRIDLLALDAADGTVSSNAAKTPYSTMWISASSLNYLFTDDFLTRLFSSK